MNKKILMTMMANRQENRREEKGRRVGVTYEDWGPWDAMDRRGYSNQNGSAESRFRDRDGREHYDNGRFAPQSNMGGDRRYADQRMDGSDSPRSYYYHPSMESGNRSEYNERSLMRNSDRAYGPYETRDWYDSRIHDGDRNMRMIGFSPDGHFRSDTGMDASYRPQNELEYRHGASAPGYSQSAAVMPLDQQEAEKWVHHMKNADGTTGPHWSMEKTEEIRTKQGISCDPIQWWTAMNMMYSDYSKVGEKLGINNVDFYAALSKAFLDDEDAQPEKLARYYAFVAKG